MRAIITCECCRHRQWLVRPIDRAESFHVICERCERVLQVAVTDGHLASALKAGDAPALPAAVEWWQPSSGGARDAGAWTQPLV